MRRGFVLVVAFTVLGLGLAGCGTSKQAKARADARSSCIALLSLGATVYEHTSVMSNAAYGAIVYAHKEANEADALDAAYDNLAAAVRAIGASFTTGQRQTLQADLDDMASACEPLVGATGSSTT